MIIKYIEKSIPRDFKRIDTTRTVRVIKKAFTQGDLIYFKINAFENISIPKSDILEITEGVQ